MSPESADETLADVPVLIDDVKDLGEFRMTRCTYFGIEASGAVHDWVADLQAQEVPFRIFGVTAAIHRPIPAAADSSEREMRRFSSAEQIDRLIDVIETSPGLLVETEHLWLPNFVFAETPARGDVFRLSAELFQKTLQFQRELLGAKEFAESCRELTASGKAVLEPSPEETVVFRDWSVAQIEEARQRYDEQRRDESLGVLAWIDEKGEVRPG